MTNGEHGPPKEDELIEAAVRLDGTAVHLDGTSDQVDGNLTLKDAAAFYGISERTLRRRIKEGTVAAYKQQTAQGYEWRVRVGGMRGQMDTPAGRQNGQVDGTPVNAAVHVDAAPAAPEVLKALELVDRLQRDNQQLAGQVGFLQAKLQDAERQIALLSAPAEEAPSIAEPAPAAAPRRPWWKRILGGT